MTESDDPRWRGMPVFRILHDAWWKARGSRIGQSSRAFGRDWEELLESAGLVSAEQRNEAERDVRRLSAAGMVELRSPRFRSAWIERVAIPVDSELRLARLFGDPLEAGEPDPRVAEFPWEPELAFVRETRLGLPFEDLRALNRFLAEDGRRRPVVPVKERSIGIFGDEKRLDALLASALFRPGRLTLSALRCEIVAEPFGWRRGPATARAAGEPVLVLENLATWDSFARWNLRSGRFSAVVYGKGFLIAEALERMQDVFGELGGVRQIEYFGDLDPAGLEIAVRAATRARERNWPGFRPHARGYRRLLEVGQGRESACDGESVSESALDWLADDGANRDLIAPVRALFEAGQRLAQEWVGWELLRAEAAEAEAGAAAAAGA